MQRYTFGKEVFEPPIRLEGWGLQSLTVKEQYWTWLYKKASYQFTPYISSLVAQFPVSKQENALDLEVAKSWCIPEHLEQLILRLPNLDRKYRTELPSVFDKSPDGSHSLSEGEVKTAREGWEKVSSEDENGVEKKESWLGKGAERSVGHWIRQLEVREFMLQTVVLLLSLAFVYDKPREVESIGSKSDIKDKKKKFKGKEREFTSSSELDVELELEAVTDRLAIWQVASSLDMDLTSDSSASSTGLDLVQTFWLYDIEPHFRTLLPMHLPIFRHKLFPAPIHIPPPALQSEPPIASTSASVLLAPQGHYIPAGAWPSPSPVKVRSMMSLEKSKKRKELVKIEKKREELIAESPTLKNLAGGGVSVGLGLKRKRAQHVTKPNKRREVIFNGMATTNLGKTKEKEDLKPVKTMGRTLIRSNSTLGTKKERERHEREPDKESNTTPVKRTMQRSKSVMIGTGSSSRLFGSPVPSSRATSRAASIADEASEDELAIVPVVPRDTSQRQSPKRQVLVPDTPV